ncbi:MAG: prolyl-tRNA synthetase associated domain-containing protein [Erysipelotrichaceae bacterium]|nr:prolyl-tRNA synthetase associated domain-containing protein [Erysipelotrichaceae bacterium]
MGLKREDIIELLNKENIDFTMIEHPAIYTMEGLYQLDIDDELKDVVVKNLFLRDNKKSHYYLIVVSQNKRVNLKQLQALINSKRLSFASAEDLASYLKLSPGAVTPLGLLNDQDKRVELYIDDAIGETIGVHPNDNRALLFMKTTDLLRLLESRGHLINKVIL